MWKRMIFFLVMRGGDQLPPGSRSKIKELMKELKELDEDLEGKLHKAGFNLLIRHAKGDEVEKQKVRETIAKSRGRIGIEVGKMRLVLRILNHVFL